VQLPWDGWQVEKATKHRLARKAVRDNASKRLKDFDADAEGLALNVKIFLAYIEADKSLLAEAFRLDIKNLMDRMINYDKEA